MTYLTNREAALHLCNGGKLEICLRDEWHPGTGGNILLYPESIDCPSPYRAAVEPDPTPALGWRAMQTAAERAAAKITLIGSDAQQQHASLETSLAIRDAILALPGPTDAQLLADAVLLPQWQAVVKCLDREKSLIWIIENTVQVLIRNLALEMLGQQRAALKAWNDGQRQPTEYEQKLAAMKKDFPNGI